MKRSASATWEGTGLEGKGSLSTLSGAIHALPYNHKTRFANEDGKLGSNPEELVAAAHAGCFSMALSFQLNAAGYTAERIHTTAKVKVGQEGFDYHLADIELHLEAKVPGIDQALFAELANNAKENCPISKALSVPIQLHWTLV